MLEADENGDGFHDDDDFELDTPKRKNRNRGKVSDKNKLASCTCCSSVYHFYCMFAAELTVSGSYTADVFLMCVCVVLPFRTEDRAAGGQSLLTSTTRINLTSAIVRRDKD